MDCVRVECWLKVGYYSWVIEIIIDCFFVDVGDVFGVFFLYEDWKLKVNLKFIEGEILERVECVDEVIILMEEVKNFCLKFDYVGEE